MRNGLFKEVWLRHVAVAIGYALVYVALRPFSDMLWASTAGLRMSCLLLVPYRYWPALCVGEFIPVADSNFGNVDQFGLAWAVFNSIPPMMIAMPLVWYCRERFALFRAKRLVNVKILMVCLLAASLLWSLRDFVVSSFVVLPPGSPAFHLTSTMFVEVLVGKYVGLLLFVPLALMVKLKPPAETWRTNVRQILGSRILLDVGALLLPTLFVLYWLSRRVQPDAEQLLRMTMFLPVAWMTLKHGWRAAAIGGTVVVIAISLMLMARPDADAFPIQAFLSFAMTCLFAVGARITTLESIQERKASNGRQALYLAQQSFYRGEQRMRGIADTLERTFGALHLTHSMLIERFRPLLPSNEGLHYTRQLALTEQNVFELVNSIHPITLRQEGLLAGLQETIGRTLDECGVAYRCSKSGLDVNALATDVQAALYRLACDAIAHACDRPWCERIGLSLRTGRTHGCCWAVLRVEVNYAWHCRNDRMGNQKAVASRLGATQFSIGAMRDHVSMYRGDLHLRTGTHSLRLTALLHDVRSSEVREPFLAPAQRASSRAFYVS